jgi:hypothetical protein
MSWSDPSAHIYAVGEVVTAGTLNSYVKDNLMFLYPPMKVAGGQTGQPYYWQGGADSISADPSGNFSVYFGTSFLNATITGWVVGASGGAPIAVQVGAINLGSFDCHASGLEGTVVPSHGFTVVWGALGW